MRVELDIMQRVIERLGSEDIDFADCRVSESDSSSIQCQDGRADKIGQSRSSVGNVRVLYKGAWGFASIDAPDESRLENCMRSALAQAKSASNYVGIKGVAADAEAVIGSSEHGVEIDPRNIPLEEKLKRASEYETAAVKKHGDHLVNTIVFYSDNWMRELVTNTRGTAVDSERIYTQLHASMVAQKGNERETGSESCSARAGFELLDNNSPIDVSVKAADRAVSLLDAPKAPSGRFTVVFHPGIAGVFVHEALGHSAEADLVLTGQSILDGKLGTMVGSEHVTIIDDPTIKGARGSFEFDSEGIRTKPHTLIENGELKNFLNSLETAARMGVAPTGSARAMNGASLPIVRMSNTFIKGGTDTFDQLISPIDDGIYLVDSSGGYVLPERGQFVVKAAEGWMIKDGKLKERVRDVSVSGLTLETLLKVDGVSREFELAFPGTCGKSGQGAPVTGGGGHVRISDMVVGGQNA